jgi:hypothetical protein
MVTTIEVLPQTWKSLFIEILYDNTILASGTAFVVEQNSSYYLITNRHNVSGRDNENKPIFNSSAIPNKIKIYFNKVKKGQWRAAEIDLYAIAGNESTYIWHEHPTLGEKVDAVAIKLGITPEIDYSPYPLNGPLTPQVFPSDNVSVVGFPFGKRAHGYLAIWSTGFLATDLTINYDGLPLFLIDCRSRQGQSGSPVIAQRNGGFGISHDGLAQIQTGMTTRLLGIYSGRINEQSDLGLVWKLEAIKEIIESIE